VYSELRFLRYDGRSRWTPQWSRVLYWQNGETAQRYIYVTEKSLQYICTHR